MRIWPAIDVRDGKCVRLSQGDFQREKVYGDNPADMACRWAAEGATGLHIVDLDRAVTGTAVNRDAIARIAREVDVELQVAGGIRDEQTIEDYLSLGIKRVVLGTSTIKNFQWFESMVARYPEYLLVTIDTKDETVFTDGWQTDSGVPAMKHAGRVSALPIAGIIYTDISTCGMQSGSNLDALKKLRAEVSVPVVAAGGVASSRDISLIAATGMDGCVIGKSLYEGKLTLTAAIAAASATHVH